MTSPAPLQDKMFSRVTLRRLGRAIANFGRGDVGGSARLHAGGLLVLLLAINGLNVLNSYVGRDFMTAIEHRDWQGFVSQAMLYVGVFALLTLAAAAVSFGVVTLVRTVTSPPAPPAAAIETASPSAAAPATPAKPAAAALTAEELGLPPGVPVGNDKGLLEVEVGGSHAVYVDGTFVGRGPTRRIPLAPGPHQVMVKLPAGDTNLGIDLKVGRRTRVALPGQ